MRLAETPDDLVRAQKLRHLCFLTARGLCRPDGREADRFDDLCRHVLIEGQGGQLLACFRLVMLPAARISDSYSAQFYDLGALQTLPGTVMELGRFCIHPAAQDPDILRLSWAAITRLVDENQIGLMFGCTSFSGADPARHGPALAYLKQHHAAPAALAPRRKALAIPLPDSAADPRAALAAMPPLLRSYLGLGGVGQRSCGDRRRSRHAACLYRRRGCPYPRLAQPRPSGLGGLTRRARPHRPRPWHAHPFFSFPASR